MFAPAKRTVRKAFRKAKQATGLSGTVITVIWALLFLAVLVALYCGCRKAKQTQPKPHIAPLKEVVIEQNVISPLKEVVVKNNVSGSGTESKPERLSRLRKVFKDSPRHNPRMPKQHA